MTRDLSPCDCIGGGHVAEVTLILSVSNVVAWLGLVNSIEALLDAAYV